MEKFLCFLAKRERMEAIERQSLHALLAAEAEVLVNQNHLEKPAQ